MLSYEISVGFAPEKVWLLLVKEMFPLKVYSSLNFIHFENSSYIGDFTSAHWNQFSRVEKS